MKKVVAILLMLVMACSLVACATTTAPVEEAPAEQAAEVAPAEPEVAAELEADKPIVIGLAMSEISDNSTAYQNAYQAAADAAGVEVIITNAQGSVDAQLSNIETLVAREVDVIHVRPIDPDGVVPAIESARAAGIPVLVTEYDISCDVDCYLYATQNVCGALQAASLIEKLEADPELILNVGYLWGAKARGKSVQQRYEGFMTGIQDYIDSGRVVIVEEQEANFKSDEANAFVEDWLQRYPDMNCVVCQNDEMANGSVQALKTNNKDFTKVFVLGINGTEVGKQNIRDGFQLCTVDMHEPDAAVLAFDYACKLAAGEAFPEAIDYSGELFEMITLANVG